MPGWMSTDARKALTDWVTRFLGAGVPAIWADQNAPAPSTTYVTLRPMTNTSVGEDYVGAPDDTGEAEIVGNREMMIYMQAFGAGALDALQTLRDSLRMESVQDAFIDAGIGFIDAERVENLSQLIATTMNERAALDVRFRANSSVIDNVGVIENVEIEATLTDPISQVVVEINVES